MGECFFVPSFFLEATAEPVQEHSEVGQAPLIDFLVAIETEPTSFHTLTSWNSLGEMCLCCVYSGRVYHWSLTTALCSTRALTWSTLPDMTRGNMEESAPLQKR